MTTLNICWWHCRLLWSAGCAEAAAAVANCCNNCWNTVAVAAAVADDVALDADDGDC